MGTSRQTPLFPGQRRGREGARTAFDPSTLRLVGDNGPIRSVIRRIPQGSARIHVTFKGFKTDYQLAREAANARGSGGVIGYLDDSGKLQPIKPKPQPQPKTPPKPSPEAKKSDGVLFKQKTQPKGPVSELLGPPTSGKTWVAEEPYPGDDEGTWVSDPNGLYEGQCVSLGKSRCPGLPATSHFRAGASVEGLKDLPVGTLCIAPVNGTDWKAGGHLVIYNGQDPKQGLLVTDQYRTKPGQKVKQHYIPWEGRGANPSIQSQGRKYRVLVTGP